MKAKLSVNPYSFRYPSPLSSRQKRFARKILAEIEGSHFDEILAHHVIAKFDEQDIDCRIVIARRNYPDQSEPEWTEWVEVNGHYANSSSAALEYYTPVFEVSLVD